MLSQQIYKHMDVDNEAIILHDCYATQIAIEKNFISFFFKNGFWITPDHKLNELTDTVRTDSSKVDFCFEDSSPNEIIVYVFRKNIFNKTIREEWDIQKLSKLVNENVFSVEFLYQYKRYNEHLFDCWLHFDKAPFHYECQIKIPVTKVIYRWNNLCSNKKW